MVGKYQTLTVQGNSVAAGVTLPVLVEDLEIHLA